MLRLLRATFCATWLTLSATSVAIGAEPQLGILVSADKPQYNVGEPIYITIVLRNISTTPVIVSGADRGNVQLKIKRDGASVPKRKVQADFMDTLSSYQVSKETTLAPGSMISFPLTSFAVPGKTIFVEDRPKGVDTTGSKRTEYDVNMPGVYVLTLKYRYKTPRGSSVPSVGWITAPNLMFKINP